MIAYATWFLGRRLLAYREFLFGAEQLAATDAVARRSSVPRSAEVATRFLYEWTTLERIFLRTVYEDQFNQATPNLRDALRRLEDEALLSNYETAKVVENLRLRNLLVHGDFPENIPVSELAKATDEIRQIRRKKLEIRERERQSGKSKRAAIQTIRPGVDAAPTLHAGGRVTLATAARGHSPRCRGDLCVSHEPCDPPKRPAIRAS